jgi:hypothetical protein
MTVAISDFLFLFIKLYSSLLTTVLVVCNLCYEGSLVVVSCNSLLLNKNGLYSPIAKKTHTRVTVRCRYSVWNTSTKRDSRTVLEAKVFRVWLHESLLFTSGNKEKILPNKHFIKRMFLRFWKSGDIIVSRGCWELGIDVTVLMVVSHLRCHLNGISFLIVTTMQRWVGLI